MRVTLKPGVRRALSERLPASVADQIYNELAVNPLRVGKPLSEPWAGHLGARVGPVWRVIYRVEGHVVEVVKVGHRADVYRPS